MPHPIFFIGGPWHGQVVPNLIEVILPDIINVNHGQEVYMKVLWWQSPEEQFFWYGLVDEDQDVLITAMQKVLREHAYQPPGS